MWKHGLVGAVLVGSPILILLAGDRASAQETTLVSVTPSGHSGNSASFGASVSSNGRYVAFTSFATDLVRGDSNGSVYDVFLRDLQAGTTELVSISSQGIQANDHSQDPEVSENGRWVVFTSFGTNLVSVDANIHLPDIYLRDRQAGTTELISMNSAGVQANSSSRFPSVSDDGRFVAFTSDAGNLAPSTPQGFPNIFVRDRQNGTTVCISTVVGAPGPYDPNEDAHGHISHDGRLVAFQTYVNNIVAGDLNGLPDVFVRNRESGVVEWISQAQTAGQGGFLGQSQVMSSDDRYITFSSTTPSLVREDTNGSCDVFVRDRVAGVTERVSVSSAGVEGNNDSSLASISSDGRYVVFETIATNICTPDTNGAPDVLVRDRISGVAERASTNSVGVQANQISYESSIAGGGRYVVFSSGANNLASPADMNGLSDIFLRDRFGETSFVSLCDPGQRGVLACPCLNAPAARNRGCNNSAVTGGASLEASGAARLSIDSLVIRVDGTTPSAACVVLQGHSALAGGMVYGQGVRCAGGSLKRLYARVALNGALEVPSVEAGDATISAQSAATGDPISPGESRWYLTVYRDPVVLGGCPASSTFNCTQTGMVTWSP